MISTEALRLLNFSSFLGQLRPLLKKSYVLFVMFDANTLEDFTFIWNHVFIEQKKNAFSEKVENQADLFLEPTESSDHGRKKWEIIRSH